MPFTSNLSAIELLKLHAEVAEELRTRGITRSSNNPTGDLAEHLFCKAFGWKQSANSNAGFDATAEDGTRYQIKGRRMTRHNQSRQLGAIRKFTEGNFEFLAGALFNEDFTVFRAALIPYGVVKERVKFITHTNSHKFMLRDDVWQTPGVRNVTEELCAVVL
jgi:hypothetical protein